MRRLLLVEDSIELAENLAEIVTEANFSAHVVHSAEQALMALAQGSFDAILSDLRLPTRSGVDLLENLRTRGDHTPVILMSAFADETVQAAARRWGVMTLLIKPVDCAQLLGLLATLTQTAPTGRTPNS